MLTMRQAVAGRDDSLDLLGKLILLGCVAMLLYAASSWDLSRIFSVASISFLLAGAAITFGGLVGFIFGIPRSRNADGSGNAEDKDKDKEGSHYRTNTNLEQISDWLTKILVGAGLTQLTVLPGHIQSLTEYAAAGMGGGTSSIYAGSILVFFFVAGFMYSYLWTRLVLAGAMKRADDELTNILTENNAILSTMEQKLDGADKYKVQKLRQQTEKAIAFLSGPETDVRKKLDSIAREFEKIRTLFSSGAEKSMKMATIFSQMRSFCYTLPYKPADVIKIFNSGTEGGRIAAIAFAQVKPDPVFFDILIDAVAHSKSAYEQYQSLATLELILPQLSTEQKEALKKALQEQKGEGDGMFINPGTDREKIADRLLERIG